MWCLDTLCIVIDQTPISTFCFEVDLSENHLTQCFFRSLNTKRNSRFQFYIPGLQNHPSHGHLKGERLYLYIYSPWILYYGRFFSVNSLMSSPWKRFKGIIIFVLWKFLCQFDTSYLENNFSVLIVVVVFKILTFSAPRKQISKFSCH